MKKKGAQIDFCICSLSAFSSLFLSSSSLPLCSLPLFFVFLILTSKPGHLLCLSRSLAVGNRGKNPKLRLRFRSIPALSVLFFLSVSIHSSDLSVSIHSSDRKNPGRFLFFPFRKAKPKGRLDFLDTLSDLGFAGDEEESGLVLEHDGWGCFLVFIFAMLVFGGWLITMSDIR